MRTLHYRDRSSPTATDLRRCGSAGNPVPKWHPEIAALVSPLFYQDNQHTFYVEPTVTETTLGDWDDWVIPSVTAAVRLRRDTYWDGSTWSARSDGDRLGPVDPIAAGGQVSDPTAPRTGPPSPAPRSSTTAASIVGRSTVDHRAASGRRQTAVGEQSRVERPAELTPSEGESTCRHAFHDTSCDTTSAGSNCGRRLANARSATGSDTHFHPYVSELVNRLITGSVPGLQAADTDYVDDAGGAVVTLPDGDAQAGALRRADDRRQLRPDGAGQPTPSRSRTWTSAPTAAYSVYNWELFYHVPLTVAIHLSRNGRYEEAQRWFHYIFDPTDNSSGPTPERFWKVQAVPAAPRSS